MKKIIIARHGDYISSGDQRLSDHGISQIEVLGNKLLPHIKGETLILTSDSLRACQSAKILAAIFNAPIVEYGILRADNRIRMNLQRAWLLINERGRDVDVLVLVTHFEYTESLPQLIEEKLFGTSTFPYAEVGKGGAWIIDCEMKTCSEA
jgi:phosphohistidine phosphatase SixA